MLVKSSAVYLGIAAAGLFAVLIFTFQSYISVDYAYLGFVPKVNASGTAVTLFSFGYLGQLIAFILLALIINKLAPQNVKLLLILQLIVPVLAVFLLQANGIASTKALLLCTFAIGLVAIFSWLLKFNYTWKVIESENALLWVGAIVILAYFAVTIYDQGLFNIVLSFADVYEYRAESNSSYFIVILRGAAITFAAVIFAYGLITKKRIVTLLAVATFILFFIYSGHKRFVFLIPFIWLAYAAIRSNRPYYIVLLYLGMMVVGTVLFLGADSTTILNFAARRTIFIPGLLTELYVDYFSDTGPLWFAHSRMGLLLGTYDPNMLPPARLVGSQFFNQDANANANWIASSYMNMGLLGIFFYAPVVAVLFLLPGALQNERNRQIFLISGIVAYSSFMQNNDLINSFLSNGVAFYLLIWAIWGNMELRPTKRTRTIRNRKRARG